MLIFIYKSQLEKQLKKKIVMIALTIHNKDTCAKSGLNCIFIFYAEHLLSARYHPVANESGVRFTIQNFGFKTGGTLAAPEGDIIF